MPNVGLKGGHGGKRLFAGGGVSTRTVVAVLPSFEEPNTGPMGCPSPGQVSERCAAIRETWDAARWEKEKRRSERCGDLTVKSLVRHDQRDSALMRNLLWRERFLK